MRGVIAFGIAIAVFFLLHTESNSAPHEPTRGACNQSDVVAQASCQLASALKLNKYSLVKHFLESGLVDINDTDVRFCQFKTYAACGGDSESLQLLFDHGLDPQVPASWSTYTELAVTFNLNPSDNFSVFLKHGADINAIVSTWPSHKLSLFQYVSYWCFQNFGAKSEQTRMDDFKLAIAANPNIYFKTEHGQTIAHVLAVAGSGNGGQCDQFIKLLADKYGTNFTHLLSQSDVLGRVPTDYVTTSWATCTAYPMNPNQRKVYNTLMALGAAPPTIAAGKSAPCYRPMLN